MRPIDDIVGVDTECIDCLQPRVVARCQHQVAIVKAVDQQRFAIDSETTQLALELGGTMVLELESIEHDDGLFPELPGQRRLQGIALLARTQRVGVASRNRTVHRATFRPQG